MFCDNCGALIEPSYNFCTKCGSVTDNGLLKWNGSIVPSDPEDKKALFEWRNLVRDKMHYISNKKTLDSYRANGVKKYQYVSVLDNKTSKICADLDGQVFPVDEAEIGVNFPPMHDGCRSTTVAAFPTDSISAYAEGRVSGEIGDDVSYEDWVKANPDAVPKGDRMARNKLGKSYLVGEDLTYKEWAEKYPNDARNEVEIS